MPMTLGGILTAWFSRLPLKEGVAISLWWNYDGKFLGFTVLPQVGASLEVEYIRGHNNPTGRSNPN